MEGRNTNRKTLAPARALLILTLCFVLTLCLIPFAHAAFGDHVIINSKDWKDVYSGVQYAKLVNSESNFLVSDGHALIYAQTLDPAKNIQLVTGSQTYFSAFERTLQDQGYEVETIADENTNLVLAQRAIDEKEIKNFIVVDPTQGYLAVAASSYAVVSKSFVLFADSENIDEVTDFLDDVEVDNVIILGYVNREVGDALEQYNPERISEGSRFANNIELVKRFQEIKPMSQMVVTNGEFIEDEVMSGIEPVLFIGSEAIPEIVVDYIRGSNIKVAVLIGNELVNTATQIRRQLGVTTFVKFARSARVPSGTMSQIEGLDLFYLPQLDMSLRVDSVRFNEITQLVEVTLENDGEVSLFARNTLTVPLEDGTEVTQGDEDARFIEVGELKTFTFPIEGAIDRNNVIRLFIVYGEAPLSLERTIVYEKPMEYIRIIDDSQVSIQDVFYSKKNNAFGVVLQNDGDVDAYVLAELVDLLVEEFETTVGTKRSTQIPQGGKRTVYVRQKMTDLDLQDNPEVFARSYFGQREDGLYKITEGTFELRIEGYAYIVYYVVAAIVVIALMWFFILWRRRKKKKKPHQQGHFHYHNQRY